MNAIISASDVKTFYNVLQCLGRFSETFWLQCSPRGQHQAQIRLSAVNSTNSAFCMFVFDPDFFLSVTTGVTHRIECQIQLKNVLATLRARGKSVERCELELIDEGEECRFAIKLHCHHGILKVHRLTYEPKRGLQPSADPNPPNFFCINAQTAQEWTEHFLSSSKNGEITFLCGPGSCIARSKEEDLQDGKGHIPKAIHTEVKIAVDEFREYSVLEESLMTFSLREFKAAVTLAETLQVPLEVNFSDGDEPLFIRLRVESAVAAEIVIATTKGERPTGIAAVSASRVKASQPTPQQHQAHQQQSHQPQRQPQREQGLTRASGAIRANSLSSTGRDGAEPPAKDTLVKDAVAGSVAFTSRGVDPSDGDLAEGEARLTPTQAPRTEDGVFDTTRTDRQVPSKQGQADGHSAEEQYDDDETLPLFFPGGSYGSSQQQQLENLETIQPTPVSKGGDPQDFALPAHSSQSARSDASDVEEEANSNAPRKRFRPLF
ncbi:hypothetical protein BCV70DRAFT_202294 [Testicularia cyperi]|uniref:DNA repair protein rad9 n=1 Tax=Testicularia cyperi TaxID=1882483 RepID=A0A317XII6_9BASI|nr:hypothetical protein BCV70DRAFT_202294 [Testicularia cyperi]